MTHVITSLCTRDGGCVVACPVECIVPGMPQGDWPIFYIDPVTCIDCGACIPACPVGAIFTRNDVPYAYVANGGEILTGKVSDIHFTESFNGLDYEGQPVFLPHTRTLIKDEIIDLSAAIDDNRLFFENGPGYLALD